MKFLLLLLAFLSAQALAKIEDNSFLLEEAFNQEWGVYQFIQKYQTEEKAGLYRYTLETEIPISDKVHQFSYWFAFERPDGFSHGAVGDVTLNYRWQPFNQDGFLIAERIGLIVPTGRVEKGAGNGVYGVEVMQSATLTLADKVMNHWNFGFELLPNAKTHEHQMRGSLSKISAGTSLIYLNCDDYNLLLEALLESEQALEPDGSKTSSTSLTLNPGLRFSWDVSWRDAQIVPGISFPTELLNSGTEHGVLVYLSIEPKFY